MAKRYKSKLIKVGLGEVGYKEKASNAYLYSKNKNAGYNNLTKYGKAYGMNGVQWCCEFTWWSFMKAYGKKHYEDLFPKTAWCESARQFYINKGQYGKDPKIGAPIFFQTDSRVMANHIGYVYKYDKTYVHTIEGNTSAGSEVVPNGGCVAQKCYRRDNPKILGYGYPAFDKKPLRAPKAVLRMGAEGAAVRKLQKCINKVMKFKLEVDGVYGEKTKRAVKQFKVIFELDNKDGEIYGKKMRKALNRELIAMESKS